MTSSGSQVEDGDTQPLSPSVYAEHERKKRMRRNSWSAHEPSEETNTTTQHTCHTGDSGYIDLLGAYDHRNVVHNEVLEELNGEEVGAISQSDVRTEIFPESKRFQMPKTPATTSKKRDHHGEFISSVGRTPQLPINPFAGQTRNNTGLMNLSQAFRATQAASSPNPNLILSDAPSERPSPAMNNMVRPLTAGSLSSPAKMTRAGLQRAVTEPRAVYISMKESQDERDRRSMLLKSSVHKKSSSQDSFDEDKESMEDRARRPIIRRNIELEAMRQFKAVKAQARPESIKTGARAVSKTLRGTPVELPISKIGGPSTVIISDDSNVNEDDNSEDETGNEEEPVTPTAESADELGEDNKENCGIRNSQGSQLAPRGPRRNKIGNEDVHPSPARQNHIRLTLTNGEMDELAAADEESDSEMIDRVERLPRGTQTVAVIDSQLSQSLSRQQKTSLPRAAVVSSSGSHAFVPQSQTSRLPHTSQIDSSMARQILETPSLNRSRSSPLSHRTEDSGRKTPRSSPPQISFDNRQSPLSSPKKGYATETVRTFNSSPPQISRGRSSPGSENDDVPSKIGPQATPSKASEAVIGLNCTSASLQKRSTYVDEEYANYTTDHSRVVRSTETPRHQSNTLRSTIPETSSVVRHIQESNSLILASEKEKDTASTRPPEINAASDRTQVHHLSKPSTAFETAQTHLTEPPPKSRLQLTRQSSEQNQSPSHSRTSGVRMFNDIAGNPSPSDEIEEVDLNINLMTNEDLEFQSAMDGSSPIGPARKRRRVYGGRAHCVSVQMDDELSQPPSSSNNNQTVVREQRRSPVQRLNDTVMARDEEQASVIRKVSTHGVPKDAVLPNLVAVSITPEAELSTSKTSSKPKERRKQQSLHNHPKKEGARKGCKISYTNNFQETPNERDAAQVSLPSSTTIAPNRVFALFRGNQKGFYPATCLEVINGDEPRYRVRFDDGTIDTVNAYSTKRLELQVGDNVKIDQPGQRNHYYVVKGFQDKETGPIILGSETPSRTDRRVSPSTWGFPYTDIFGHKTVIVAAKPRQSTSDIVNTEAVAVADIYITQMMWSNFKNRGFSYRPSLPVSVSGLRTPSEQQSSPSTPSSRTRRCKSSVQSHPFSILPKFAVSSICKLFSNMVFSITNIEDSESRKQVAEHILSRDGHLLESPHGFEELFEVPDIESASPYKQTSNDDGPAFQLSPDAQLRGFTCLVADKHCRSAKFIQALALGIPCLATRWVTDCIRKEQIVPWEPYLLPSGESTFLDGAVRSRLLPSSSPDSILLPAIVTNRPTFLQNRSVLLITGKGKEAEVMKNYPFIAYGLGAQKVCCAGNLEEARKAVAEAEAAGDEWDWVYFYEDGKYDVRQAEKIICGAAGGGDHSVNIAGASRVGRKRKRTSGGSGENAKVVKKGKTRVVGTDFLVQSLILGMLIEE